MFKFFLLSFVCVSVFSIPYAQPNFFLTTEPESGKKRGCFVSFSDQLHSLWLSSSDINASSITFKLSLLLLAEVIHYE